MVPSSEFDHILGQEEAVRELSEEMQRDRLSHAYLLEGPVGTGRTTLARAFAAAVLQTRPEAVENHADYLELPRDVPRLRIRRFVEREGSTTESVEHTPVLQFMQLRPVMGPRRACLIPDAERMQPEAANAFLKTLEEPPAGALILLTTAARDRLLATIVSRCRRVCVRPLSTESIATELGRRGAAEGAEAQDLAEIAEGSLGTALSLAQGDLLETWRWMQEAAAARTPAGAVRLADGMIDRAANAGGDAATRRSAAGRMLDLLALYIRRELREGLDPRVTAESLQALWNAGEQLAANVRMELVLHTAALNVVAALRRQ